MSALARVSRDRGRPAATPKRPPAYLFEPDFVREILAEQRAAVLQEEEDYGYRAGVGSGEDWHGDHD